MYTAKNIVKNYLWKITFQFVLYNFASALLILTSWCSSKHAMATDTALYKSYIMRDLSVLIPHPLFRRMLKSHAMTSSEYPSSDSTSALITNWGELIPNIKSRQPIHEHSRRSWMADAVLRGNSYFLTILSLWHCDHVYVPFCNA